MGASRRAAQFGLGFAVVVLLLCLSILVAGGIDAGIGNALEGTRALNFHLRDLDNHLVSLSDLRGKVVSVFFGGDTESPSKSQELNALQNAYRDDTRVKVLAVYNDDLKREDVLRTIAPSDSSNRVDTLADPTAEVSKLYKVGQTPTLFVIDQDGIIRLRHTVGQTNADLLADCHRTIDSLLAVKSSPMGSLAQGVLSNVK
jgi:peroxiredoxin